MSQTIFKITDISNEEIMLRSLHLGDAKELFNLVIKNKFNLTKWFPWVNSIKTIDDEISFICQTIQTIAEGTSFEMGIFMKQTSNGANYSSELSEELSQWKIIGMCGLNEIKLRCGWVGYWLDEDYRGKGIVTKACKTLISNVAKILNLSEFRMYILPENTKSKAVAIRCGFNTDNKLKQTNLFGKEVDAYLYILSISQ